MGSAFSAVALLSTGLGAKCKRKRRAAQGRDVTDARRTGSGGLGLELNTKGRYAVMAMADLAKFGEGAAVPLSAIADRQGLSLSYLEQIFLRLRRAGLVESERGRTGGYVLGRPAYMIRISQVMEAVEEETRMTRCLDSDVGCLGDERCFTHGLWHALGGHIATFLSSVTLQEVLDGIPPDKLASKLEREGELAAR